MSEVSGLLFSALKKFSNDGKVKTPTLSHKPRRGWGTLAM